MSTPARTSTVVIPNPSGAGAPTLKSLEREGHRKIPLEINDVTDPAGRLEASSIVRILNTIQRNTHDATLPARTDPLGVVCILQNVSLTSGTAVDLKHTLGVPFRYAYIIGAGPGSATCILARVAKPTVPQDQYASVTPTGTGTYDIAIHGG